MCLRLVVVVVGVGASLRIVQSCFGQCLACVGSPFETHMPRCTLKSVLRLMLETIVPNFPLSLFSQFCMARLIPKSIMLNKGLVIVVLFVT